VADVIMVVCYLGATGKRISFQISVWPHF